MFLPGNEGAEALLVVVCCLNDLLMVRPLLILIEHALVSDQGEGKYGNVTVYRRQHFGNCAHS